MRSVLISTVAPAVVLLLACESDEKKMQRLQSDQAIACFEDSHPGTADQQAHDMDPNYKQTPVERQHTVDSLVLAIHAKCGVATRDLNKFMSGR
jgi:hypothetical protein